MRHTIEILIGGLCLAAVLSAVDPRQPVKPQSPELNELNFLVGQWSYVGETKLTGQKVSSTLECYWEKSGKLLMCEEQGMLGSTAVSNTWAIAYDTKVRDYTMVSLSGESFAAVFSGTVLNGKLSFFRDGTWQNKPARYQFERIQDAANGVGAITWRMSVNGGPWIVSATGKSTRVK